MPWVRCNYRQLHQADLAYCLRLGAKKIQTTTMKNISILSHTYSCTISWVLTCGNVLPPNIEQDQNDPTDSDRLKYLKPCRQRTLRESFQQFMPIGLIVKLSRAYSTNFAKWCAAGNSSFGMVRVLTGATLASVQISVTTPDGRTK